MRGLEPRLSKYLTVKYIIIIIIIIIKQKRLIKHQLFTSDVDVESWLKFLNKEGLFYFEKVQYVYHCCLCLIFDQTTMAQEQKYLEHFIDFG